MHVIGPSIVVVDLPMLHEWTMGREIGRTSGKQNM